MKKILIIIGLMGLTLPSSFAQGAPWSVELQGGWSLASLPTSVLGMRQEGEGPLHGLQGRLLLGLGLSEAFRVQFGMGYVPLGQSIKHLDHEDVLRVHSLEFPLLFQYSLRSSLGSLDLDAGPTGAFHLQATAHNHENETESEEDLPIGYETTDYLKPFNLGLQAGLGLTHRSGWGLRLRYQAGLLELSNMEAQEISSNYLALSLAYRIPFPKVNP
jgi:hypothetical protein